jgi:hypothetical protein
MSCWFKKKGKKEEALKYSYLKQDDAQVMDVELFQQIIGIDSTISGPILDRSKKSR